MNSIKRYLALGCFTAMLAGCKTVGGIDDAAKDDIQASFTRLYPVTNWDDLAGVPEPNTDDESQFIEAMCGFPRQEALGEIIASALVGSGLKLAVGAMDKQLKKAMEAHSKSYTAGWAGNLPNTRCWRMIRGRIEGPKAGPLVETVDAELLVAMEVTADHSKLSPVRLVVQKPAPKRKSSSGKYGVAMTLKISTSTQKGFVPVIDEVVMKTNATEPEAKKPFVRYFFDKAKHCELPNSTNIQIYCGKYNADNFAAGLKQGAVVEMTATVVESGAPSGFLKFFSSVFSGASEDIGDALAEYAAGKINPEEASTE